VRDFGVKTPGGTSKVVQTTFHPLPEPQPASSQPINPVRGGHLLRLKRIQYGLWGGWEASHESLD
jgi:hypothetical protein